MAMGDFVEFYKGNFHAERREIEMNGVRWAYGEGADPREIADGMRHLENVFNRASPELLTDTIWRDLYKTKNKVIVEHLSITISNIIPNLVVWFNNLAKYPSKKSKEKEIK